MVEESGGVAEGGEEGEGFFWGVWCGGLGGHFLWELDSGGEFDGCGGVVRLCLSLSLVLQGLCGGGVREECFFSNGAYVSRFHLRQFFFNYG